MHHTKGADEMNAVHIMQDGTRREHIEGIVIKDKTFYKILCDIQQKKVCKNEKLCS